MSNTAKGGVRGEAVRTSTLVLLFVLNPSSFINLALVSVISEPVVDILIWLWVQAKVPINQGQSRALFTT